MTELSSVLPGNAKPKSFVSVQVADMWQSTFDRHNGNN